MYWMQSLRRGMSSGSTYKEMSINKTINVLFCGIGGQGVLSASEILGQAALLEGYHVKKSEVHGMAQRGGSVESHLRFGAKVFSPLIPLGQADYLVSFYHDESVRLKHFLKNRGLNLDKYLDEAHKRIKDSRYVNIFLLGILAHYLDIREENWIKAIASVFASKNLDENKRVFLEGRAIKL